MGKHKTAISLTLDRDLCDWFSGGGKNRSLEINSVLRRFLRKKLNDDEDGNFDETLLEDLTINNHLSRALALIQDKEGSNSLQAQIIVQFLAHYRGD